MTTTTPDDSSWPIISASEKGDYATTPNTTAGQAFWERKRLDEMSPAEWEALCDGCGRCCVHKLEDEATGEFFDTRVACRLLDRHSCLCSDYPNRHRYVPDCISLTPERVASFEWLPSSCAYRRLAAGRGLAWWHPLVSGDPNTVHQAGISVQDRTISETELNAPDELMDHVTGAQPDD